MVRSFRKTNDSSGVNNHKTGGQAAGMEWETETAPMKSCLACRYYIAFLGFLVNLVTNGHRMALAVTLVDMTNHTSTNSMSSNITNPISCPVLSNSTQESSKLKIGGEFDWRPELQGFILGAGFFGFAFTPIIGGKMAELFGCKKMILAGNTLAALSMLLSPIASSWHPYCLMAAQLMRGVGQGLLLPSIYKMISNWTPRSERGLLATLNLAGFSLGSLLAGVISGVLCETPHLGWRSVFYFYSCFGILVDILFALTFYETPDVHPRISKLELKYITEDQARNSDKKKPPVPWFEMFTSIRTYALMIALFGQRWVMAYFASVHPTYLSTILHYRISQSGFLSSLPFMLFTAGALFASSTSDWLYRRKYVGVDKLRKGCNFIACFGFSLCMLGVYIAECNGLLSNIFFTISLLVSGSASAGSQIAAVDMTPNFAATLVGMMAPICNQAGIVISITVGFLTKNKTLDEWKNVFILNIAVAMASGIVFAVFGSAEVQPWNFNAVEEAVPDIKQASVPEIGVKEVADCDHGAKQNSTTMENETKTAESE